MNTASHIGKKSATLSGLSATLGATSAIFGKRLWIWPILASIVLAAIGWYTNGVTESAMRKQLADRLETILNTEVEAVHIWMTDQKSDAELLAAAGPVLPLTRELAAQSELSDAELLKLKQQAALRTYLTPQLVKYGFLDFYLISRSLRVIAADEDLAIGKTLDGYRAEFCKQVLTGKSAVSKPFPSVIAIEDDKGQVRAGLPTLYAAAPISDQEGQVVAVLAVRVPVRQFTTILGMAKSGRSGDTFAFDSHGKLLSESRFENDFKHVGLIADAANSHSILTLELRDPQVNMMTGQRPSLSRAERPLTRMASDAVKGGSGTDIDGYRDCRGVPVIGAWKWLPEHDLGIATEMSVAEAYEPLAIVRTAFLALFVLSVLAAAAVFVFLIVMAGQQNRVEKAERMIKQLGQYTLESKIGSGGMGSVYRARHAYPRRPTAVKMLNAAAVSEEAQARFEREVQLTSQLNHPNTIAIYDYGRTSDGVFFYAMELLEGIDLDDLVKQHGPLPEGRVVAILKQVCASLSEAHRTGMIHRDIKPANILVTNRAGIPDFVKVLDFGLVKSMESNAAAHVTAANVTLGTPQYMSPEAVERPDSLNALADIYSIGAVGYYLLTGTPVFSGKTIMEICMKHVKTAPEPPSARLGRPNNPELEAAILRCLAKKPEDRFPDAVALMEALDQIDSSSGWSSADATVWWFEFEQRRRAKVDAALPEPTDDAARTTLLPS